MHLLATFAREVWYVVQWSASVDVIVIPQNFPGLTRVRRQHVKRRWAS